MTSGFWKGLLHGGLISVGALAVLSLVSPMPQQVDRAESSGESAEAVTPEPVENSSPTDQDVADAPAEVDAEEETVPVEDVAAGAEATPPAAVEAPPPADPEPLAEVAPDAAEQPVEAPVASAVDLPVGSEFGRGGDHLPNLPTPLDAPQASMGQTEAPGVIAPAAEPAPVTIAVNDARPEAADGAPSALATDDAEEAPEFAQPDVFAAPSAPAAPELAAPELSGAAQPDSAPDMSAFSGVADTFSAVIENDPDVAVQVIEPAEQAAIRPSEQAEAIALPDAMPEPAPAAEPEVATEPEAVVAVPQSPDQGPRGDVPAASPAASPAATTSLDLSLPPDITELRNMERD